MQRARDLLLADGQCDGAGKDNAAAYDGPQIVAFAKQGDAGEGYEAEADEIEGHDRACVGGSECLAQRHLAGGGAGAKANEERPEVRLGPGPEGERQQEGDGGGEHKAPGGDGAGVISAGEGLYRDEGEGSCDGGDDGSPQTGGHFGGAGAQHEEHAKQAN